MCQFAIKLSINKQNKRNLHFGQIFKITNLWNCMSRNVTSHDKNAIDKDGQFLVICCLNFQWTDCGRTGWSGGSVVCLVAEGYRHAPGTARVLSTAALTAPDLTKTPRNAILNPVLVRHDKGPILFLFQMTESMIISMFWCSIFRCIHTRSDSINLC